MEKKTAIEKMEWMRDAAREHANDARKGWFGSNRIAKLWDLQADTWQHAIDFVKLEREGK